MRVFNFIRFLKLILYFNFQDAIAEALLLSENNSMLIVVETTYQQLKIG